MKQTSYTIICLLLLCLDLSPAFAAEQVPAANNPASDATSIAKDEAKDTNQRADQTAPEKPAADATGAEGKSLSKVFQQFVPSESISADNAVPFPVDI